jgi:hypothetical protein
MKLNKLLEGVIGKKFNTVLQAQDPEKLSTTWKVNYTPDFTSVVKSYNILIRDYEKALKENKIENDPVLHDVLVKMKGNRAFLHKTLKRKYPNYIEKLSHYS